MGQALYKGMVDFGGVDPKKLYAFAPNQEKLIDNAKKLGFTPCKSLKDLADSVDTIILACKPYQIDSVLTDLGDLKKDKTFFSVAAGWDMEKFKPYGIKVQYIMPNTPCQVGEGVILLEEDFSVSEEDRDSFVEILKKFSKVIPMPGYLIDAGSAISGCAPAFVDLFIEALADGAVKNGVPRQKAYEIIPQMMIGSAKLMALSGKHPGELKDQVCSPGGTTIKGISALEDGGFRASLINAVDKVCGK